MRFSGVSGDFWVDPFLLRDCHGHFNGRTKPPAAGWHQYLSSFCRSEKAHDRATAETIAIATTRAGIDDIVARTARATVDICNDAIVRSLAVPRTTLGIPSPAANRPLRITARRLSFEERTTQQHTQHDAELCCITERKKVFHRSPPFNCNFAGPPLAVRYSAYFFFALQAKISILDEEFSKLR